MVLGASWGTGSRVARTICDASASGRTSFSEPLRARPIGERWAATMTASGTWISFDDCVRAGSGQRHGRRPDPTVRDTTGCSYLWGSPTARALGRDRKSTRLNSSHVAISYAVFCLKKKKNAQAG